MFPLVLATCIHLLSACNCLFCTCTALFPACNGLICACNGLIRTCNRLCASFSVVRFACNSLQCAFHALFATHLKLRCSPEKRLLLLAHSADLPIVRTPTFHTWPPDQPPSPRTRESRTS